MFRSKPPIRRTGRGVIIELGSGERDLLGVLAADLRVRLSEDADSPDLRRLFPTAYHDDPTRDAEYQILARSELTDGRLRALDVLQASLDADLLTDEELGCWMTTVNQIRLVLGTHLDIGEADDPEDLDPTDPSSQERMIYHWLTHLLALIVDASPL